MADIISKTKALPDGSMLWCVHHKGSYYDDGTVPVDVRTFVLAKSFDDAKQKTASLPSVLSAAKRSTKELEVAATIVTIETLIPARNSSDDGRNGWTSSSDLQIVGLTHPDDRTWKLAVCLVPVE